MNAEHATRIANHSARLSQLLAAAPIKYSEWPPPDVAHLRQLAGVYHFYEREGDRIDSIYVGKGGFGGGEIWSLYSRLKQHFQVSQKYALLGKASRVLGVSAAQAKARFQAGTLQLQWLAFGTRSEEQPTNLSAELLWFECFAIAILKPRFTDA